MVVLKNGEEHEFTTDKIRNAIIQAANQDKMPNFDEVDFLTGMITGKVCALDQKVIPVEDIENIVISVLYENAPTIARNYSSYKIKKEKAKKNPNEIEKVLFVDPEISLENGNKDAKLTHIKNAYLAEVPSKQMMRELLPKDCLEAHDRGVVYFHDMAYAARSMTNCCLLNLEELFKGCKINGIWVDTPKSFRTACTVATQILTHATSLQYGGITVNLLHLAKFVDVSRQKIKKQIRQYHLPRKKENKIVEDMLKKEIKDGLQTFLYQNNTLCAGTGQAVFLSVSIYLNEDQEYKEDFKMVIEEFLRQRIAGIKDKNGLDTNPNFPKILYFLDDDSFEKDIDLTTLAAECSAKRLTPDYMSVKQHQKLKGVCMASMGCRSWLSPYDDADGNPVTWGRGNCGVQTLNLPYIMMENNPDKSEDIAISNLKHYLDIANRDALWRLNHCAKIKAGESPLMWVYGGLLRLDPEETLEKYVYNGYMTVSIGYSGLYEAVKYITDENQWGEKGNEFAHKIFKILNDNNDYMKNMTGASFGLYGAPKHTWGNIE